MEFPLKYSYLTDTNLSLKSKSLLAVILCMGDGCTFSIKAILLITKEGESAMYDAIKELINYGYCQKVGVKYSFHKNTIK